MFVDSHCHLNDERLINDISDVLARAKNAGIHKMLSIGTSIDEMQALVQLTNEHSQLYCSVGVHPHDAKQAIESGSLYDDLSLFSREKNVVGIGETGLDYYYENSPIEEQKKAFQIHIEVAEQAGLPLIIHTRDAEEDTIELLKDTKAKGVLHCFSGSQWLADKGLELGFYISISGIVTFKNTDELRNIVKTIPLERLLVETDAPYLAPIPYRGKRNEPAFMIETAKIVAELKGVDLETLGKATTDNFNALFAKAVDQR